MQLTMDRSLKRVLSVGNKEQNMHYPPTVFQEHFNLVTAWLLDRISEIFPNEQLVREMAKPFLKRVVKAVEAGMIKFEADHRNLLSIGANITVDGEDPCGCTQKKVYKNDPLAPSVKELASRSANQGCKSVPVRLVEIDEWDYLTQHPYKMPTLENPIACIFEGIGIKICPTSIIAVEVRYLRQPKEYKYNYTMLPDDTYQFNQSGSEESEWNDTAGSSIFKGLYSLYTGYTKDTEGRDYSVELKKVGLF